MTKFTILTFASLAVMTSASGYNQVPKPIHKPIPKPEVRCKTGPNGVVPHDLIDFTGECKCPDWHKYDAHYGGCLKQPL